MYQLTRLLCFFSLLCSFGIASSAEVVTSFDSKIVVNTDSSINVTETIAVVAEGKQIKRGIYRDLPTSYRFSDGRIMIAPIGIVEVLRNGKREDYHLEQQRDSIRIYFGNRDRMLRKGKHVYTFSYRAKKQLRYFENHDELYWNVTGNEWFFPIEKASASISWPDNINVADISTVAYTGDSGAREQFYSVEKTDNSILFQTTKTLQAKQGFTIATKWAKGLIAEPAYTKTNFTFLYAAAAGLFSLLMYYLAAWFKVGRDPKADKYQPDLNIDDEYSPAAMRFIKRMSYDQKTFTTAIISLAVKGHLVISESDDEFTLRTTGNKVPLSNDEKKLVQQLMGSKEEFTFNEKHHYSISRTIREHENLLRNNYGEQASLPENKHFLLNRKWSYPAWAISFITLFGLFVHYARSGKEPEFFMTLITTGLGVLFLYFAIRTIIKVWQAKANIVSVGQPVIFMLIPCVIVFIMHKIEPGIFLVFQHSQFWLKPEFHIILGIFCFNILFTNWLRKPTSKGRRILDRINNFKFYLAMRDKGYLEDQNAHEATPELFDRYLPYAVALDIESEWSDYFEDVFTPEVPTNTSHDHNPDWYEGDRWDARNTVRFSKGMGSALSHSVSSSSVDPTSHSSSSSSSGSGFSGGGSSGGGGGGGGGGGW